MKSLNEIVLEKLKISKKAKPARPKTTLNVTEKNELLDIIYKVRDAKIIDLSHVDVSEIKDMERLFAGCKAEEINVTGWDTSNVRTMDSMFVNCSNLKKIHGIEDFNLDNCYSLVRMFNYCSALEELDLSDWDTRNVEKFDSMFTACKKMTSFEFLEHWDMKNAKSISYMFQFCISLKEIDLSDWHFTQLKNCNDMFKDCKAIKTINLSGWDVSQVKAMYRLVADCIELEEVDLTGWNTSSLVSCHEMFMGCVNLKTVHGLEKFDTSHVMYAHDMFGNCSNLTADLRHWTLPNIREKQKMFYKTTAKIFKKPKL